MIAFFTSVGFGASLSLLRTGGKQVLVFFLFAPLFEKAGVSRATAVTMAAAIAGILAGGLTGGPVGTLLIEHLRAMTASRRPAPAVPSGEEAITTTDREARPPPAADVPPSPGDPVRGPRPEMGIARAAKTTTPTRGIASF
jgi:Na+/glutamate symporter